MTWNYVPAIVEQSKNDLESTDVYPGPPLRVGSAGIYLGPRSVRDLAVCIYILKYYSEL